MDGSLTTVQLFHFLSLVASSVAKWIHNSGAVMNGESGILVPFEGAQLQQECVNFTSSWV